MSQSQFKEHGIVTKQNEKGKNNDSKISSHTDLENHPGLINQILRELKNEKIERNSCNKITTIQNAEINLDQLEIQMNQEALNSPKCSTVKGKRGRRSLKELGEADGLSREQQKID